MPTEIECREALGGDIDVTKETTLADLKEMIEEREAMMDDLQANQKVHYPSEYLGRQLLDIQNKAWDKYRTYHPRDGDSLRSDNTGSIASTGGQTQPDNSSVA